MFDLQCQSTNLPGVVLLQPKVVADARGSLQEVYRRDVYAAAGVTDEFVQDNLSRSACGVLRGLHYQTRRPQAKLVSVLRGAVLDVVVDIRRGSPAFGQTVLTEISGQNHRQVFVPAGCAHGFCVLSDEADVLYKCSGFYDPEGEGGILWSDPALSIPWPTAAPLLSRKDQALPRLMEIAPHLLPLWNPTRPARS